MAIDEYASNPANYDQVFQALLMLFRASSAKLLSFKRTSPALSHFLRVNSIPFEVINKSDGSDCYTLILNPALRLRSANIGIWHIDHF